MNRSRTADGDIFQDKEELERAKKDDPSVCAFVCLVTVDCAHCNLVSLQLQVVAYRYLSKVGVSLSVSVNACYDVCADMVCVCFA